MNIKELKQVINSEVPEDMIERLVINILAKDENVIPMIMEILAKERETNRELILDSNLELSRAHIYIEMHPQTPKQAKKLLDKNFVMEEIRKHYEKYKGVIGHCFNKFK